MTAEEEDIIKHNIDNIMEQWEAFVPEMKNKLNDAQTQTDGKGNNFWFEVPVEVQERTLMLATLCDPKTGLMQVSHYKWEDVDENAR